MAFLVIYLCFGCFFIFLYSFKGMKSILSSIYFHYHFSIYIIHIVLRDIVMKTSSSALQQTINWIKFIKWNWLYYSRRRRSFQEKPRLGLPEVSKRIDSAIIKTQGDQTKHSCLEKKNSIMRKWTPRTARNITINT